MRQETVASRQRLAIMLALADVPPPCGLLVSQIAVVTPWPASVLYSPLYQLERDGLVGICRNHLEGMVVGLVEHPDLAAMDPRVTVPDDRGAHE